MAEAGVRIGPRAMRNVTMTVEVGWTREMRVRIWLATQLMRLAGRVLGCRVAVKQGKQPEEGGQ